jgi:hypothetical protein
MTSSCCWLSAISRCPPGDESGYPDVAADLVRSLRPMIVELGLAVERELTEVDQAVRAHLADPRTVMVPYLWFTVWGRKPAG